MWERRSAFTSPPEKANTLHSALVFQTLIVRASSLVWETRGIAAFSEKGGKKSCRREWKKERVLVQALRTAGPSEHTAAARYKHTDMANIAVQRIKREFKEVLKSEEVWDSHFFFDYRRKNTLGHTASGHAAQANLAYCPNLSNKQVSQLAFLTSVVYLAMFCSCVWQILSVKK